MSPHLIHDKNLLLSMQKGDKTAFEILFKRYYAMLCAYGSRMVSLEDAEEIVQDVLLWLWESREIIVIESSLNQYLFKAVYYRAINRINKNQIKQKADTLFYKGMLEMLQNTDYYQIEELMKHINDAIENLPPSYREAFMMHRFGDLSYKEIANTLNVSPKTVDYRIQQALKILRENLKDYLPVSLLWLLI